MKVSRSATGEQEFMNLKSGDCFLYGTSYYMKTTTAGIVDGVVKTVNAVDLELGKHAYFNETTQVHWLDCELLVHNTN